MLMSLHIAIMRPSGVGREGWYPHPCHLAARSDQTAEKEVRSRFESYDPEVRAMIYGLLFETWTVFDRL